MKDINRKQIINDAKKIVIKVGTTTITHPTGLLNINRIENLVRQLSNLHNKGIDVVLVSSGAIGAGMGKLGLSKRPKTIPEKQAAAAVGQGVLMHMYEKLFSEYGKLSAQILLTKEDISNRKRFLYARNSFFTLLNKKVIPIVNENDAVAVDEIKFGDNDTLSALVTSLIEADLLILLSDIDGLYDCNPNINSNAKLISIVKKIDKSIMDAADQGNSKFGTGGMITKVKAGKIAVNSSASMIIANGAIPNVLNRIMDGEEIGTIFIPDEHPMKYRKRWIAYNAEIKGDIIVDKGAKEAIKNNKSLLMPGILSVNSEFCEGEVVSIRDENNVRIARGIINYSSAELRKILSMLHDSEKKEHNKDFDEVIHINNMALFI